MNVSIVQLRKDALDAQLGIGRVKVRITKEQHTFAQCINQELYQTFIIEINIIDKLGLKKE